MALKIGVQMDHVSNHQHCRRFNIRAFYGSTKAWPSIVSLYTRPLQFRGGVVSAAIEKMQLKEKRGDHYSLGKAKLTDLKKLDVILLRQDPPFDMSYITTTHLLERIHPDTLVVNDPASVRNAPEKILVMDYPDLMPETLITRDFDSITKISPGNLVISY